MDSSNANAKNAAISPKFIEYDDGNKILKEFSPFFRVHRDGRIERLAGTDVVPAGNDPKTGVKSKDIVVTKETNVSARLYIPGSVTPGKKLPLLIYFHGGVYVVESAFSCTYHNHLNQLVSQANIVVVSVDYRLAPEHPLPIMYFDSWFATQWISSHSSRNGEEPWLNEHVDFGRVFLGGDCAGGNVTHNVAMGIGAEKNMKIEGIFFTHPVFFGSDAIVDGKVINAQTKEFMEKLWLFVYPESCGTDDTKLNPNMVPDLEMLGSERVLLLVAELDFLKEWQLHYYDLLSKSGWKGKLEIMESKGEGHLFYLLDPASDNASAVLNRMVCFINQE